MEQPYKRKQMTFKQIHNKAVEFKEKEQSFFQLYLDSALPLSGHNGKVGQNLIKLVRKMIVLTP